MPLNRLKSIAVQYPKADDALPMISKLKFDRAYIMAFEQVSCCRLRNEDRSDPLKVFGRTIICEDLATAAQYTRSHGLNAVTVEGDRADRKGALTGGFHDVRRSRMDSAKAVKRWREAFETDSSRQTEVKEGISRLEQQISQSLGKIQVLEAKRKQILDGRGMVAAQATWAVRDEEQSRQRVGKLEAALVDAEGELRDAAGKRTSHEEELRTPMRQQLTEAEVQSLESLTQESEEQKQNLVKASQARQKASSERNQLEIELSENLRRNREELRAKLDDLEGDAGSGVFRTGEIELRNNELRNLIRSIEALSDQVTGEWTFQYSLWLIRSQSPKQGWTSLTPKSPLSHNSSKRRRTSSSKIPVRSCGCRRTPSGILPSGKPSSTEKRSAASPSAILEFCLKRLSRSIPILVRTRYVKLP